MKKIILVFTQIICTLGILVIFKLVNYVPISDMAVCFGIASICVYPLLLRLLLRQNYKEYCRSIDGQFKFVWLPLFCAEIIVLLYYRQEISSLCREILQVNGLR